MGSLHYWFSVGIEFLGMSLICFGLCEMLVYKCANPATFLIPCGSLVWGIGSGIFAKWIKWKKECKMCKHGVKGGKYK